MFLQIPQVYTVSAYRGYNVGYARMTLDLLHLHRTDRVHLTTQVVQLLLLKHLARVEEGLDLFEKYFPHSAKDNKAIVTRDVHTFY